MKVLFVTYDFPYPTNSGGKTRAYNLIKQKNPDVELSLFSFVRNNFDEKNKNVLEKIGVKKIVTVKRKAVNSFAGIVSLINPQHSIFHNLYLSKKNNDLLLQFVRDEGIDLVHFESYYTGFFLSEKLAALGVKQIFGTENIEADVYAEYIKMKVPGFLKPFYAFENKKIRSEEEKMMRLADLCLAVTNSEKNTIEHHTKTPVFVIENGVDIKKFSYRPKYPKGKRTVLFVGNFSYHPNVDAAEYFYASVFSKMDTEKYQLKIIGKEVMRLSFVPKDNVLFEEFVDDIIQEYHGADVFVSPVRLGGGTNFKILESMAVGLPVVASPHRLTDLGVTSGNELLIAQTADEYRTHIDSITTDIQLRHRITKNARSFIEKKYSWDTIGKKMNNIWYGLHNE